MFSTLSSFIPPALQSKSQDRNTPPDKQAILGEPHLSEEPKRDMAVDGQGAKKRKERTHESFIVVRPPPSKTNHPLNLQVQLVPPSTKEKDKSVSSRRSFDSTTDATEEGIALSRTSSNRSDVSMYSGYTSVTSLSSVSTSSTTSSRRMIIPLYNLQAHNVMTNVIVDAGTDAKVAKFQKRGLEIIGLAVLEPIEVWPGASLDSDFSRGTTAEGGHLLSADAPHTATSSAVSLTSDTHNTQSTSDSAAGLTTPVAPRQLPPPPTDRNNVAGGARKFFGKMFKKKNAETSLSISSTTSTPPSPLPVIEQQDQNARSGKRSSLLLAASQLTSHLPSPSNPSFYPQSQVIHSQTISGSGDTPPPSATFTQHTILGIQPAMSSPVYPPRGKHPKAYVWVVRRWLKQGAGGGNGEGLLGMIGDRMSSQGTAGPVEVRFEWKRSSKGRSRGRKTDDGGRDSRRTSKALSSNTPSTSSFAQQRQADAANLAASERAKPARLERSADRESRRSTSPRASSNHTRSEESPRRRMSGEAEEDDGEESDPEDSETPWICSLILRGPPPITSPSFAHSPTQQQHHSETRIRVGAVVPAPHHPKVVSLLKIPFPLPDIEVEKAIVRKRVVTPAGVARPATAPSSMNSPGSPGSSSTSPISHVFSRIPSQQGQKPALILTAEEIKDIVSCTGLWLVVREGFGGVGKERRKGDGWRIRG